MCQTVPRWTTTTDAAQAALEAAIRRIGSCILIGHSQGGGFAIRAAQHLPELVMAAIALEPHGLPNQMNVSALKKVPFLFVMADFNSKLLLTDICQLWWATPYERCQKQESQ